jgi:hypothetical protein
MNQNTQTANHASEADELFIKIASEPASREIMYKTLNYCFTPRPLEEVKTQIRKWVGAKAMLHSAQAIVNCLLESGGLETLKNESAMELQTTPAGKTVADAAAPNKRLIRLFRSSPEYADIFISIIRACAQPKTTQQIESMLADNEIMARENIFASYFIGELEDAGALEWDVKWVSTQSGMEAAAERNLLNHK